MHPATYKHSRLGIFILKMFIVFMICCFSGITKAQSYFSFYFVIGQQYQIKKTAFTCACQDCCESTYPALMPLGFDGTSMAPDGKLYLKADNNFDNDIYIVDTLTGVTSLYYAVPDNILNGYCGGLIAVTPQLFYTINGHDTSILDSLFEINTAANTITNLGAVPYAPNGEIAMLDGELYFNFRDYNAFPFNDGIARLNLSDPMMSEIVFDYPDEYLFYSISASKYCHTLLGSDWESGNYYYLNLLEGTITYVCPTDVNEQSITSMQEFLPTICAPDLDLDCNDSSGATEGDFNSPDFNCLSAGSPVSDEDVSIIADAKLEQMTINIVGFVPDGPNEILEYTGSVSGVSVSGEGTGSMTLSNISGFGTIRNFMDALQLVRYRNLEVPLTPGLRTIEVQFTTEVGSQSNIATAFIEVIDLPVVEVDLGPDTIACEGTNFTFNAGNPGAMYSWSTGSHNQMITVSNEGTYSVTVSDGVNCPNSDEAELLIVPNIIVNLVGEDQICDNESVNLEIQSNAAFPVSVTISANPGSSFQFPNVQNVFAFVDLITETTTYALVEIIPSQEACVSSDHDIITVEVLPSFLQTVELFLCDGDSIWLGNGWEHEAGIYENTLQAINGCDSMVTTTISVLPAIQIANQSTTCDSASAGVFVTFLNNPNGCDTVITTTVTLLPSDTTTINLFSCNKSNVGIVTQTLVNQFGCDSLIVITTSYIPPADTTSLFQTTCDSSLLGSTQQLLLGFDGCDSLVITTISIAPSDTTYQHGVSCDPSSVGLTQTLYNNINGCDSLVFNTIIAGTPDTTYLFATSCEPASLGVFETHFITPALCDSTVIKTITFSAQDSTFLTASSCDPDAVGVFVQQFINQFGRDSIVTETISLLPSNESFITSTSCDPTTAGTFDHVLINQFGCDSIVHETISLLPTSVTAVSASTCASAEAGVFVNTLQNQFGCDSVITLTVSLIPADTTHFNFLTCDQGQVGSIQNTFTNQEGCDSLVITSTSLFPLPQLNLIVTSDFNGYGISCFGEHDGSLQAELTGEDPFQYTWSTGDTTQGITGLGAGDYSVLITDTNGCETSGAISMSEPPEFSIGFEVSQPDCFTNETGTITIVQSGGVAPIRYSIDGINYQPSPIFNSLSAGSYTITALDANDCETKEIILINVAVDIEVDLGQDRITMPGDTSMIEALVNVPYDSLSTINWTGLINPPCPTCLTQFVSPIITTAYSLTVSDAHGCTDKDSVIIYVQNVIDIYVPNVFSPNDDGINDRLLISAGAQVEEIESFSVYDRWGNMVFYNEHFLPDDPNEAWNGGSAALTKRDSRPFNPGVFAYRMIARFKDQRVEVRFGDVTLLR